MDFPPNYSDRSSQLLCTGIYLSPSYHLFLKYKSTISLGVGGEKTLQKHSNLYQEAGIKETTWAPYINQTGLQNENNICLHSYQVTLSIWLLLIKPNYIPAFQVFAHGSPEDSRHQESNLLVSWVLFTSHITRQTGFYVDGCLQ